MQKDWNRWWIVVAAMLGLIVGQGSINGFAAGVFLKPVGAELGFGRGEISSAISLSNIVTALVTPFFGRLVDRHGVRPMLLGSILAFAVVIASLSQLSASTTLLLVMFGLSGLVAVGQNPTAYCKVITERFDDRRGLALGLALAGVGLGTALIPQLAIALIGHFGWRIGYVGLGCAILVLAFLPVAIFVREPAGAVPHAQRDTSHMPGISFPEAIRTWRYWAMTLCFFFAATTVNGSFIHLVPLLTDRGISVVEATGALSAAGVALICGRVFAGWCSDRVFAPFISLFFLLSAMAGMAVLAFGMGPPVLGTILLGMGIGAEVDLMSFLISRYFGVRFFATLHGFMFMPVLLGNAVGASILGWCFQLLGSYLPGFILFEGLLAVGCVLIMTLGKYRYPAMSEAEMMAARV